MGKTVLIVEDDKDVALALAVRLKASGWTVLHAFDGMQGMIQGVKHHPDAILLDISMPAGGGLALAKRYRDNTGLASTPILFMTASRRPELREEAKKLGASAFIEKPFDAAEVLRLLAVATGGS